MTRRVQDKSEVSVSGDHDDPMLSRRILWVLVALSALAWLGTRRDVLLPLVARLDPELLWSEPITDPENAGIDFALQGEYASDDSPWAVQVRSMGQGRFEGKLHRGGLPGAGWDRSAPETLVGRRQGAEARLHGRTTAEIAAGALVLRIPGEAARTLPRVERTSPTLGAPPPPGATVLFQRGGPNAFDGSVDSRGWLAEGATTRAPIGDASLHLEFRIPFEPDLVHQKRGNSGVYVQRRYEVQILDSFAREPAADEAGGLYKQRRPNLNMSFPPLAWQTYDIDFRAARFDEDGRKTEPARITVRHNGVLIHDDVALTDKTGMGEAEGPEPGPIYLQDHGHPVRFRNIWMVPGLP